MSGHTLIYFDSAMQPFYIHTNNENMGVSGMVTNRAGENGATPFRTGRFFNVGAQWYFATREAIDQGPFSSKPEAKLALTKYIEHCKSLEAVWG